MLKDKTAIVGIGQTAFGKGRRLRAVARVPSDLSGARRLWDRARRGRRSRVVHARALPRGRRRAQRGARRHHVLLADRLRRGRRLWRGDARGDGCRDRASGRGRRVASTQARVESEPSVGERSVTHRRQRSVEPTLRVGEDACEPVADTVYEGNAVSAVQKMNAVLGDPVLDEICGHAPHGGLGIQLTDDEACRAGFQTGRRLLVDEDSWRAGDGSFVMSGTTFLV
jgi:hypothetical protein